MSEPSEAGSASPSIANLEPEITSEAEIVASADEQREVENVATNVEQVATIDHIDSDAEEGFSKTESVASIGLHNDGEPAVSEPIPEHQNSSNSNDENSPGGNEDSEENHDDSNNGSSPSTGIENRIEQEDYVASGAENSQYFSEGETNEGYTSLEEEEEEDFQNALQQLEGFDFEEGELEQLDLTDEWDNVV